MARHDGTDNLQPVRTEEEARAKGRAGGIASGKARRKKRALLESARAVLESDMPEKMAKTIEKMFGKLEEDDGNIFAAMVAVMAKEALSGNVGAFNSLKDLAARIDDKQSEREVEDDPLTKSLEEMAKEL